MPLAFPSVEVTVKVAEPFSVKLICLGTMLNVGAPLSVTVNETEGISAPW